MALDPSLGRSVQSLDDDPHFAVCYARRPPAAARRISIKLPVSVKASGKILGDRVNIVDATLKGDNLKVELDGEGAHVSGEVTVNRGGRVELLQKRLEIMKGKVTLNPEHPRRSKVDVEGHWDEGSLDLAYRGQVAPIDLAGLICTQGDRRGEACFAALLLDSTEQPGAAGQAPKLQVLEKIAGKVSSAPAPPTPGAPRAGSCTTPAPPRFGVSTYYGLGATGSAGAAAPLGQRTVVTLDWRFWRNWVLRGRADMGSDQQTIGADLLWQYHF